MRRLWAAALSAVLACSITARATVTSSTRSQAYAPVTPTTVFAVPFVFASEDDLVVTKILVASPNTETVLTRGVDYSVRLPAGGVNGRVTLTSSISSTYTLLIERHTEVTQETSFKTQGTFNPALHEAAFDKNVMMLQDLAAGGVSSTDIDAAIDAHEGLADPHSQYVLLAGRLSGQSVAGSTGGGNLRLYGNALGTGQVKLGFGGTELVVDESLDRVGILDNTPSYSLDVNGTGRFVGDLILEGGASALTVFGASASVVQSATTDSLTLKGGTLAGTGSYLQVRGSAYAGGGSYIYAGSVGFMLGDTSGNEDFIYTPASDLTLYGGVDIILDGGGYFQGPTLQGGAGSGADLTLKSTSHGTKGNINLGSASTYDEANTRLGINTTSPTVTLDVDGDVKLGSANQVYLTTGGDELYKTNDDTGFTVYGGTTTDPGGSVTVCGPNILGCPDSVLLSGATIYLQTEAGAAHGQFTNGASQLTGTLDITGAFSGLRGINGDTPVQTNDGVNTFWTYTMSAPSDCNGVTIATGTSVLNDYAVLQLPDAAASNKGCQLTVINGGADGAIAVRFSPHASDGIEGSCVGVTGAGAATVVEFSGTADSDIVNTLATANKGDRATVVSDGTSAWWVIDCVGEWASVP
jgi:hypothetical protein